MTTTRLLRAAAASAALATLSAASTAQVGTALFREGSVLAGFPGNVTSISGVACGFGGAYAFSAITDDGTTALTHLVGALDGGAPVALQSEGPVGGWTHVGIESFFGITGNAGGAIAYSPTISNGVTSFDSVWLNDTPVAIEGDPIPSLPGFEWRFGSRPGLLSTLEPVWVGGIDQAGVNAGNGLFRGLGAQALLRTGDLVGGLPAPLGSSAVDFDYQFSQVGLHYLTAVDTTESAATNTYLVSDGAALLVGGGIVGEAEPVPASVGGLSAENWFAFDFVGITDAGHVFFTGDTAGPIATDEFVFAGGSIALREGDVVDGHTLTGSIDGGYQNAHGDFAVAWDVVGPSGALEALVFNGRVVQVEGQPVDLDGDGALDPTTTLRDFAGIAALVLGEDRRIHALAEVDTAGTTSTLDDVRVALRVQIDPLVADGQELSLSAGGAVRLGVFPPAGTPGDFYFLLGSLSGSSPGIPLGAVTLPLNYDVYSELTITAPNTPPLTGNLGVLDAFRTARAEFALGAGTDPALAGLTVTHAYVVLDLTGGGPELTYASNPVDFTLVP